MQDDTFAIRLKALLQQKRHTLAEVARALDLSAPSVHRWTRGGEIDYGNLRALARFLDVNWIWLRYGDEAIQSLQETMADEGALADERRRYISQIMASEARLNLAQDMARIVTWEWKVLTDELTAGPGSEHVFGRSVESLKTELLPFRALDLDSLKQRFHADEMALEWDFGLAPLDGTNERWFTSRGRLLLDAHERPQKIVGVSIEITHRKHVEQALERSEYILRKVIETIPVGLFIADSNGKITTANPEAERIWGEARLVDLDHYGEYKGRWAVTGRELVGKDWTLARAVQAGEASRGEIVHIDAFDGQTRTIIMSAIPLLDQRQGIMGAIEVNQDITSLERTGQELRNIAEQWSTIFNQPSIGIAYEKDGHDRLIVNQKLANLLGTTPDALDVPSLGDLLDGATAATLDSQTRRSNEHGSAVVEMRGHLSHDGNDVEVNLHVVSYCGHSKGAFRLLAFVSTV